MIRRIHQIHENTWMIIFSICRNFIHDESSKDYIVDSFPVAVCQNYKRFRCKLFPGKKFHGYTAFKKPYFFGIKVHMIVSSKAIPIEFVFSLGSEADIRGLHRLEIGLLKRVSTFRKMQLIQTMAWKIFYIQEIRSA